MLRIGRLLGLDLRRPEDRVLLAKTLAIGFGCSALMLLVFTIADKLS